MYDTTLKRTYLVGPVVSEKMSKIDISILSNSGHI